VGLPRGVCDALAAGRVVAVRISAACEVKQERFPACGAWSLVGAADAGGSSIEPDGGTIDAGADADAATDGATDASDAGDASEDGAPDAGPDADAGADASLDAGAD